jgi:hypothetical protein
MYNVVMIHANEFEPSIVRNVQLRIFIKSAQIIPHNPLQVAAIQAI